MTQETDLEFEVLQSEAVDFRNNAISASSFLNRLPFDFATNATDEKYDAIAGFSQISLVIQHLQNALNPNVRWYRSEREHEIRKSGKLLVVPPNVLSLVAILERKYEEGVDKAARPEIPEIITYFKQQPFSLRTPDNASVIELPSANFYLPRLYSEAQLWLAAHKFPEPKKGKR